MVWLDSAAISFEEGSQTAALAMYNEGRLEGFEEGVEKGLQTAALAMYKNGLAVDFIAQTLNISLENAQSWLSQ